MDELKKLPPVTRTIIAGVLLVTLPVLLQLVSIYPLVWITDKVTKKFEIWRLVTPFLFGGKGIPLIFDTFLLFRGLNDLEESHFQRRTDEMAWAVTLMCGAIIGTNLPLQSPVFFRQLLVAVTHLWAQTNPTNRVSLFGLINIRAPYFPFALVALELIQGGPQAGLQAFTGIVAAHLYYFAAVIYPRQNNGSALSFLSPPEFYTRYLGNGPVAAPAGNTATDGSTYRAGGGWGFRPAGGNRLGATPGSAGGIRAGAGTPTAAAGRGTTGSSATAGGSGSTGYRWGSGNRLGES